MSDYARLASEFASLLTPTEGNDAELTDWITQVRSASLPHLLSFTNGLELDRPGRQRWTHPSPTTTAAPKAPTREQNGS